jgi:hypothetical protein
MATPWESAKDFNNWTLRGLMDSTTTTAVQCGKCGAAICCKIGESFRCGDMLCLRRMLLRDAVCGDVLLRR